MPVRAESSARTIAPNCALQVWTEEARRSSASIRSRTESSTAATSCGVRQAARRPTRSGLRLLSALTAVAAGVWGGRFSSASRASMRAASARFAAASAADARSASRIASGARRFPPCARARPSTASGVTNSRIVVSAGTTAAPKTERTSARTSAASVRYWPKSRSLVLTKAETTSSLKASAEVAGT